MVDPLQINVETYERYQLEDFFLQNYKNVCDHERQKNQLYSKHYNVNKKLLDIFLAKKTSAKP